VVRTANGAKLGKSLASAAVDPADPLPGLRRAWRHLGQDPAALDEAATVDAALAQARESFDAARIPSRDVLVVGE
jgi:glutamyl-Q tRNA(Asp) synthetase